MCWYVKPQDRSSIFDKRLKIKSKYLFLIAFMYAHCIGLLKTTKCRKVLFSLLDTNCFEDIGRNWKGTVHKLRSVGRYEGRKRFKKGMLKLKNVRRIGPVRHIFKKIGSHLRMFLNTFRDLALFIIFIFSFPLINQPNELL